MVVFTCNHCGASIKKQVVQKHYDQKCRNKPIFVSCMDCQKDFKNQEYDTHIKCITEAQKYSGKDYVPKANQNKGEQKQESWIEIVKNIISQARQSETDTGILGALSKLEQVNNVPRKEKKFKNFLMSACRLKPPQMDRVWMLFEPEANKKKINVIDKPVTENQTDNTNEKIPEEIFTDEPEKKKKKKSKNIQNGEESVTVTENGVTNGDVKNLPEEQAKKNKKQKPNLNKLVEQNGTENTDEKVEEINKSEVENLSDEPAKKKKKKRKNIQNGEESDTKEKENGEPMVTNGNDEPEKKKSKKNKNNHVKKDKQNDEVISTEETVKTLKRKHSENGTESIKSKKNKNKKLTTVN